MAERYTPGCTGWMVALVRETPAYWTGENTWASLGSETDRKHPLVFMTRAGAQQAFTGGAPLPKQFQLVRVREAEAEHIESAKSRLSDMNQRLETATEPGERFGQIGWITSVREAIQRDLDGYRAAGLA